MCTFEDFWSVLFSLAIIVKTKYLTTTFHCHLSYRNKNEVSSRLLLFIGFEIVFHGIFWGFDYSKMASLGPGTYSNTFWIILGHKDTSKNTKIPNLLKPIIFTYLNISKIWKSENISESYYIKDMFENF